MSRWEMGKLAALILAVVIAGCAVVFGDGTARVNTDYNSVLDVNKKDKNRE